MRLVQSVFSIRPNRVAIQGKALALSAPSSQIQPNRKRFNKKPFQIAGKPATILRKEHRPEPSPEMATACKHPRVRIVSRHEDTEFVECLECGDVFDSEEFRDMEIEETAEKEETADDR
jgi:hypothetical protein